MKKVKILPSIPITKIYMVLAPMMAMARNWKVGHDYESRKRAVDKYIIIASIEN